MSAIARPAPAETLPQVPSQTGPDLHLVETPVTAVDEQLLQQDVNNLGRTLMGGSHNPINVYAMFHWIRSGAGRELDRIAQASPSPQEINARRLAEIFSSSREEAPSIE